MSDDMKMAWEMAWRHPYIEMTPFPRHFYVVFDVAPCLLNLYVLYKYYIEYNTLKANIDSR